MHPQRKNHSTTGTRKFISIAVLTIVLYAIAASILRDRFTPNLNTLYYLYSSIFQGFAALVGILLFMLGFGYQRGHDSAEALERRIVDGVKEVEEEKGRVVDLRTAKLGLMRYYNSKVKLLIKECSDFVESEKRKERPLAEDQPFQDAQTHFNALMDANSNYLRLAILEGRYETETRRLEKLPRGTLLVLTPLLATILLSLVLLALSDTINVYPDYQSSFAIMVLFLATASLIYVSYFLVRMFEIIAEERPLDWYRASGFPDTHPAEDLLKWIWHEITGETLEGFFEREYSK